jgi:sugar (pentulose or hexulose) kinase
VKAAVVTREGALLGTGRGSIETIHTADGGAEQDPERVWQAVLGAAGSP